ncbi:MAG: hypothetical protein EPO24_11710 [Bacteroidetes bacterium]|nr:MAG: hypothetical protein EPO24_11710 [Bacteroidota bacterium]
MWEQELIPDSDTLFLRVHKNNYNKETHVPRPIAFDDHGGAMSTDWNKYSTPEETRNRTPKKPDSYGVLSLIVKDVRSIHNQKVEHTPRLENRDHTDVIGLKDTEARIKFSEIFKWEILPPQ